MHLFKIFSHEKVSVMSCLKEILINLQLFLSGLGLYILFSFERNGWFCLQLQGFLNSSYIIWRLKKLDL